MLMFTDGKTSTIAKADVIEREGKLWFVPQWLDTPALGRRRPARIIRLDLMAHQFVPGLQGLPNVELVVNEPLPAEAADYLAPPPTDPRLETVETPEFWFPIPPTSHRVQ